MPTSGRMSNTSRAPATKRLEFIIDVTRDQEISTGDQEIRRSFLIKKTTPDLLTFCLMFVSFESSWLILLNVSARSQTAGDVGGDRAIEGVVAQRKEERDQVARLIVGISKLPQ